MAPQKKERKANGHVAIRTDIPMTQARLSTHSLSLLQNMAKKLEQRREENLYNVTIT
jgi:hypothetical protein